MSFEPSPAQRAAITAPLGPVLVVAGPGAGKTFCLIGRVGHLIAHAGLAPERVLAVTFTNKAAEEIAARLAGGLGAAARAVHRGTLHALCAELLRAHGALVGVEQGFGIADEAYQHLLLARLGVWHKQRGQMLTLFGRRRLEGYTLTARYQDAFDRYAAHLRRRHLLDFDALIASTRELLTAHPSAARAIAARWDAVLVDEFQDLNPAQYTIVRALAGGHRNVFAVGDDEQSIFSWTGADPTVLKRFADDFAIAEPIVLERNRRCSVQVFATAKRLLAANTPLFAQKAITADRASAHEVCAYAFVDDEGETEWLVADLARDRAADGRAWGHYALLYRTHRVGNALESRLVAAGIPCRLARGRSLRDDPAIRFVVAALRLMRDPDDPVLVDSLAELLLPDALLGEVRRATKLSGRPFLATLATVARAKPAMDADRRKLWRFFYDVENLKSLPHLHTDVMAIVDELLARRIGEYRNLLEERHDELSDPGDDPGVVALAEALATALDGKREVVVPRRGGAEIAVQHLLLAGGVTTIRDAPAERVPAGGEPLAAGADVLATFKALQLVHAQALGATTADVTTFDLETTDADVGACEIVELAAVKLRNGAPVDRFHRLVRPERPIDPTASGKSHGYTDADVADAAPFAAVWPAFREFVGGDLLVAHNAYDFDVPVLERMVHGLGDLEQVARFRDLVFYDTLPLARDLVRGSARLESLAERFGIDPGRPHRALDDAATLAAVFTALRRLDAVRRRKTALVHLLDWLAVGLALEGATVGDDERGLLLKLSRIHALGPYSDALDRYAAERDLRGDAAAPSVDELIARLGGRRLMLRLRAQKTAEQRYPEAIHRIRAVAETTRAPTLNESIERFLHTLALTTSEGADVARHRVNLLTLHSTKGLEFPCVYVVGVEDEEFLWSPDGREPSTQEVEEARRLLYVGMTRAEDRLVLTWAARRGGWRRRGRRFLEEMGLTPVEPGETGNMKGKK